MPSVSPRQERYVYSQAAEGKPWAKKWLTDEGHPLPKVRRKRRRVRRSG